MLLMTLIPIACLAGGFYAGVTMARRFHAEEAANLKYMLQHQYDRIKAGVDADDPLQPYTPPAQVITADFERKFRKDGRAITRLNKKGA